MSVIVRNLGADRYAEVQKQSQNKRLARTAAARVADSDGAITAVALRTTDTISLTMALPQAQDGSSEEQLPYKERWYPGLKFDEWA